MNHKSQVEGNESDCIEINLNNIQGIDQETWLKFFAALARNTTVEGLTASNCDLTDTVANAIADCLEQNRLGNDHYGFIFLVNSRI